MPMLSTAAIVPAPKTALSGGDPKATLVVGMFKGGKAEAYLPAGAAGLKRVVAAAGGRPECTGESGRIVETFSPRGQRVWVVGLGEQTKCTADTLRGAAAAVVRKIVAVKGGSGGPVVFALTPALNAAKVDLAAAGRSIGEAVGLLSWDNAAFKGKATPKEKKQGVAATVAFDEKSVQKGAELGMAVGEAANLTRSLSETPPNIATTAFMAEQAKKMAKKAGLEVTVFAGKDLVKERLEGHINVGKASENKPCMVRIAYTPKKAKKDAKPLVLIGKTMTYDTGGLSLKISNGMVGMKRDKDGGCAVIGAMKLCGETLRPDYPVVAYLCVAENSISDEAYRPDDVITYRNGVTVEVTNTDAEGRLVLADALCYTCDTDEPAAIIELSTLTGGVITALGSTYAGLFCEDDALRVRVEAASAKSGERVWRLPMHQEYRDMMKSPVADILNSNPNRKAHAGQGAAFLSYFVKEGVPFCHLDIAGVHVSESDSGMYVKGSSGFGVRLLADVLGV